MDDEKLVKRISKNNEAAWSEFWDHYNPVILAYIFAYYPRLSDYADDIVQEVWIKFYKENWIEKWDFSQGSISIWFSKNTYYVCRKFLRKLKNFDELDEDFPESKDEIQNFMHLDLLKKIDYYIKKLNKKCRNIFQSVKEKLSYREIEEKYNIPVSQIGGLKKRCRKKLIKILEKNDIDWK